MKKTLIALAALAATGAFAQSSVTMYGLLDMGYKSQEQSNAAGVVNKTAGIGESVWAGNRIGFKGTEDLGGGLKANFVIEQGLSPTTGNLFSQRVGGAGPETATPVGGGDATGFTASTNRQSFIGLAGGFGEVRVGYTRTNVYELASYSDFNMTAEGLYGADTFHTFGYAMVGGTRASGLTYISPVMAGFKATVQYGTATNESDNSALQNDSRRVSLMVNYGNGPLTAAAAYTRASVTSNFVAAATLDPITGNPVAAVAVADQAGKLWQLAAGYDFGVAKVTASYNKGDDGAPAETDYKSWQIGARVPFGAAALVASYGKAVKDTAASTITDDKGYQVGVTYALSKRTSAYALIGRRTSDGTDAATVDTRKGTALGLTHTF